MESSTSHSKTLKGKRTTKALLGVLIFFIGLYVGRYIMPAGAIGSSPADFVSVKDGERQLTFSTFWETWDKLHANYIGDLDDKKLFYGAVQGMVGAAGDPYTVFADPEAAKAFNESLQGSFEGIGAEIGVKNESVIVISPLEGLPAQKAGLRAGDIIIAVDKKQITSDMTLDQVIKMIRGPKGQKVTLTVFSVDDKESKDIDIIRDTIEIESVKTSIENGIDHIRITNFNADTSDRFDQAIKEAKKANVKGIILDLRGNPGGFLQAAVEIASHLLEPGKVVVSEKGKENKDYKSRGGAELKDVPIVVLVDGGSASASEILAGSLLDQRQVEIIGTKTFGKGSVQELLNLKDGSSLKVTVAKWFTPSGKSINEHGIDPTIEVQDDRATETDEQLERAKEELNKQIK